MLHKAVSRTSPKYSVLGYFAVKYRYTKYSRVQGPNSIAFFAPQSTPERITEANFEKDTCLNFMFQNDFQY